MRIIKSTVMISRFIRYIWNRTLSTGGLSRREISTFFWIFRCLGRDFRAAAVGFSTFLANSRCLGRDSRATAVGFSTFLADSRFLGRDFSNAVAKERNMAQRFIPSVPYLQCLCDSTLIVTYL